MVHKKMYSVQEMQFPEARVVYCTICTIVKNYTVYVKLMPSA